MKNSYSINNTDMNTTLSIKRVGYILRVDFLEHKMYLLLFSICCFAGWVFLLYNSTSNYISWFYMVMMLLGINYCSYVGRKLHQPKGIYLTLPATAIEKCVALLIEGLFFMLLFNLLYWMGAGVGRLLSGYEVATFSAMYGWLSANIVSIALFFLTLLLVFYATFGKRAFLLYLITIVLVTWCMLFFGTKIVLMPFKTGTIELDGEAIDRAVNGPLYLIPLVLSAGFLYLVYYKLKRKQFR